VVARNTRNLDGAGTFRPDKKSGAFAGRRRAQVAQERASTRVAFSSHPRCWRDFRYVYPVISRRSKGLSIGVNLSPGRSCNFNCVYCQVDRSRPARHVPIDFDVLAAELSALLADPGQVFADEKYRDIPARLRTIKDIAFSGDGEPTASPAFPAATGLVAELRGTFGLADAKIILLTNACLLREPAVLQTLAFLDNHNGEIWAKLDAGTQAYFERVNRTSHPLPHVLDNILVTARVRPIVIQSLFMQIHDAPPPADEIAAYVDRLRWLLDNGGQLKLVQVYTVARPTAEPYVSKLAAEQLESIAAALRPLGVPVETFA
jgi:wyosine [tRNA(Phe)-imidazoG37] synthetase (radical SAM superfamily)